jgi:hypothetical protein
MRRRAQKFLDSTYLATNRPQFWPHEARQYVCQERQVDLGLEDLELSVARVQREGCDVRFACLDRAGQKVESEELHLGAAKVRIIVRSADCV